MLHEALALFQFQPLVPRNKKTLSYSFKTKRLQFIHSLGPEKIYSLYEGVHLPRGQVERDRKSPESELVFTLQWI